MTKTVGFDVSALTPGFKEHAMRGIGRYVAELNRYFEANFGQHTRQTNNRISIQPFRHEEFSPSQSISNLVDKLPFGKVTVRQQILFPLSLAYRTKNRFDILHFPAHVDAPSWSIRDYIVTVHDLIPLVLADLYKAERPSWRFHLARYLELRAIRNATHLIAISQHTANDVHRILGVPFERISIVHQGLDDKFLNAPIASHYNLNVDNSVPIVSYIGGIDPRKNINTLVRGFGDLVQRQRESSLVLPRLVIAGRISKDRQYPKLKALIKELSLEDLIIETDFISDDELFSLLAQSSAFFFPSLYEGFGLPPLEAMARGVAVVSSNTSCMPEVLGDAALYADPTDPVACGEALYRVINNPSLRAELSSKGKKQAQKYKWEDTARNTVDVYEKLLSS